MTEAKKKVTSSKMHRNGHRVNHRIRRRTREKKKKKVKYVPCPESKNAGIPEGVLEDGLLDRRKHQADIRGVGGLSETVGVSDETRN